MSNVPAPGLQDPVLDAQQAFRIALDAMARPGRVLALGRPVSGLALGAAMAHLLLALTDEDTPVWWQPADRSLPKWLRFHTGAPAVAQPGQTAFAVVADSAELPELPRFAQGSPDAPERSCTLLVEVPSLASGLPVQAHGPGINDLVQLTIAGLPEGFWAEWQANHAIFPLGVDIFFTCGDQVLGLPRTARIGRLAGV